MEVRQVSKKSGERFLEVEIRFVALLNPCFQFACEVWHMFPEIGDSGLPVIQFGGCVSEQVLEDDNQVCGVGDVEIQHFRVVLIEDGARWGLEAGCYRKWIASFTFLLRYRFEEIVVYIFRLPIGKRESVFVEDHAVNNDTIASRQCASGIAGRAWRLSCFVQQASAGEPQRVN